MRSRNKPFACNIPLFCVAHVRRFPVDAAKALMKDVLAEKLASRPDYHTEMGRELAEEIKKKLKGECLVSAIAPAHGMHCPGLVKSARPC